MMEPTPSRPHIPGYGLPESNTGLLSWKDIQPRLEESQHYWLAMVTPDGKPHAIAIWGVWLDDVLHVGGGPETLWQRSLRANPNLAVHLEDGSQVVMLEGAASLTSEGPLADAVMAAYKEKYDFDHPAPFWSFRPSKAFAWTKFEENATRWHFEGAGKEP